MAEEEIEVNEENQPKKSKKKLIIIIAIAATIVIIIGVVVLFLFRGGEDSAESEDGVGAEDVQVAVEKGDAIYFDIKPAFIINFNIGTRQRFLQLNLSVKAYDQESINAVETHLPLIKNNIVLLISGSDFEHLRSDEGRVSLREGITIEIQKVLDAELGRPGIDSVLFTNFVMQ